jgi:hypothetical protein
MGGMFVGPLKVSMPNSFICRLSRTPTFEPCVGDLCYDCTHWMGRKFVGPLKVSMPNSFICCLSRTPTFEPCVGNLCFDCTHWMEGMFVGTPKVSGPNSIAYLNRTSTLRWCSAWLGVDLRMYLHQKSHVLKTSLQASKSWAIGMCYQLLDVHH